MIGGKTPAQSTPTIQGIMTQASTYGKTIPSVYGTTRCSFLIVWGQNLRQGGSGKKGK